MKKILSGLLIGSIIFGGAVSVYGAEVNGEDSASITVNGTLGQDNKDPEGPNIGEGSKDWINVTLDTANIFYTTKDSGHTDITSPDYTITNNSGRGVKIYADAFTLESGNLDNVESLSIGVTDALNNAKEIDLKTFTQEEFLTLANNEGKLDIDSDEDQAFKNETTFKYSGKTKADHYKNIAEKTKHTLVLGFEALDRDGNPVVTP